MYKHTYIYWCSVFKAVFPNILDVKKNPAELKKKSALNNQLKTNQLFIFFRMYIYMYIYRRTDV